MIQDPDKPSLIGLSREEIARLEPLSGEPAFRSQQIVTWVYQRSVREFPLMTDIPKRLRERLAEQLSLERLPVLATEASADESARKFLFDLAECGQVEAVLIRTPRRKTLCISTQAGCAYGCRFCATGAMGLRRNLTAHEILSQVLTLRDELLASGATGFFNLVFMGMGEPLENYRTVVAAIRVMHDDFGLALGHRRITISTVGLAPQMRNLAEESLRVRLALSLNATDNETRSMLMPVNRRYPLEEVLPALRDYGVKTGSRVTLEYILIDGVNDSSENAKRLAEMAVSTGAKINLIRFNAHSLTALRPSPPERVRAFHETLLPIAPAVTIRDSRGADIRAACGQLSTAYETGEIS